VQRDLDDPAPTGPRRGRMRYRRRGAAGRNGRRAGPDRRGSHPVKDEPRKRRPPVRHAFALLACLAPLLLGIGTDAARGDTAAEVRIGRISKLTDADVEAQAAPFLKYLENQVPGFRFRVVHLESDDAAMAAALRGDVDFLYVTPSVFVQLEVRSGAMVIATAERIHGAGVVLKHVGGVIFCRSDRRDIATLADLRAKRVMGLNPRALGGWISALREFDDEGIDPAKDLSQVRFGANPEAVADAVAKGEVDAGVLSLSEFPLLLNSGRYPQHAFTALPPRRPYPGLRGLPVVASTRLYPGTAFVKMPHVDDRLAVKVATALFGMPEKGQVAESMLVAGWTLPANYQPVHECLRQLNLAPYEDYGTVTLWGAVGQHWQEVTLSLTVLLGGLMVAMVVALRLNRQLRGSQSALKVELAQRKQAERTLFYQADLLAHTRDAIVAADAEYRVTFWNDAAARLYGFTREEALGRRIEDLVQWEASGVPREEVRRLIEVQGEWSGEISFKTRQGTTGFADLSVSRLQDSDGRPIGSVSGIRDINEKKRLEEQLLQSQKMQAIGVLAGGVAHDFNNLLTVISGYCELARHAVQVGAPAEDCLAEVIKAAARASELTQQLLAFGRKQVLQLQVIRLNGLVEEMQRLLERLIGEDIVSVLELDPAVQAVRADPGQMQTVIINLAVNARDAMPKGGRLVLRTAVAEFSAERPAPRAEVLPGRYALLTVEDTGVGMDEATVSRIFEPFFTTKELGKGTGLGLASVYGIVKQSGGHIWVESAVARGTRFTVCLPEVPAHPEVTERQAALPSPAGEGHVLVVEDQREVRNLACRILSAAGYSVTPAADGNEALRLAESGDLAIDLLLTDIVMPGMAGTELALRMRAGRPGLKVLFMSGYSEEGAADGLTGTGNPHLQKPFSPAQLTAKVLEVLGAP
jgi:PAS domain S-box-containing protein